MCIVRSDGVQVTGFRCHYCPHTIARDTIKKSAWDISNRGAVEDECDPPFISIKDGSGKKLVPVCSVCLKDFKEKYPGRKPHHLSDPELKKYRQQMIKKARATYHNIPHVDFCDVLKTEIKRKEKKGRQAKTATA